MRPETGGCGWRATAAEAHKIGENHFSFAFTYAWMAASDSNLVSWRNWLIHVRKGGRIFL